MAKKTGKRISGDPRKRAAAAAEAEKEAAFIREYGETPAQRAAAIAQLEKNQKEYYEAETPEGAAERALDLAEDLCEAFRLTHWEEYKLFPGVRALVAFDCFTHARAQGAKTCEDYARELQYNEYTPAQAAAVIAFLQEKQLIPLG